MTEDEVRDLVRKGAREYAGKPAGSTGIAAWARAHSVDKGALSHFMTGRRAASTDLLAALGLKWQIVRIEPLPDAADEWRDKS